MGRADEVKGKVKEALGNLTDNDQLKQEGRVDRAKGQVKDVVDKAAERAAGERRRSYVVQRRPSCSVTPSPSGMRTTWTAGGDPAGLQASSDAGGGHRQRSPEDAASAGADQDHAGDQEPENDDRQDHPSGDEAAIVTMARATVAEIGAANLETVRARDG